MSDDQEDGERRRAPRTKAVLEVSYEGLPDAGLDYVINLGQEGLSIATNQAFVVGQSLDLKLHVARPMLLKGIVRWRRPPGRAAAGAIGVQFVFDDPQVAEVARPRLARLIRRMARY